MFLPPTPLGFVTDSCTGGSALAFIRGTQPRVGALCHRQ